MLLGFTDEKDCNHLGRCTNLWSNDHICRAILCAGADRFIVAGRSTPRPPQAAQHRPHLVRPRDRQPAQQIWVDFVAGLGFGRARMAIERLYPHPLHQRLHVTAADLAPLNIAIARGFVYLAVALDWFSRRVLAAWCPLNSNQRHELALGVGVAVERWVV
jgi:hypothetical protein